MNGSYIIQQSASQNTELRYALGLNFSWYKNNDLKNYQDLLIKPRITFKLHILVKILYY